MSEFLLAGCELTHTANRELQTADVQLITPTGEVLWTQVAVTEQQKIQGLSGVQSADFAADQAMIFLYAADGVRSFWMPDTYFNLDIFFLDADLTILDVERDMPAYPGRENPSEIARTRSILSRHVLEMRADSELAESLHIGDQLQWQGEKSVKEIITENSETVNQ